MPLDAFLHGSEHVTFGAGRVHDAAADEHDGEAAPVHLTELEEQIRHQEERDAKEQAAHASHDSAFSAADYFGSALVTSDSVSVERPVSGSRTRSLLL